MTIYHVDILWGLMLLGVGLFTTCVLVFNPVLHSMRVMGIGAAYALGLWMLIVLPLRDALTTWFVFAMFGGVVAFAYELWARRRFAGAGRPPRPLVLLRGFLLWPTMIPEAIEGMLIDLGVLTPSASPPSGVTTTDA
ncbi:MAG: hypothetical protein IT357_10415 [Gemmatimonadaceae bacterium]|jgi:hypothetical protein|nr:hypothetical protein [Gemmatimonadaceae bacterium]